MPDQDDAQAPATNWNPPAADISFDDLFAADEPQPKPPQAAAEPAEVAPSSQDAAPAPSTAPAEPTPQAPYATVVQRAPSEPFIKTRTGTVYKSLEEASQGIETKDTLIGDLRQRIIALTGEDPLRTRQTPQTGPQGQQSGNYLNNGEAYTRALTDAATRKDWDGYKNIQTQLMLETIGAALEPYMPVVQNVGRQQAIDAFAKEVPSFRDFYGSAEYQKVLEDVPTLRGAIGAAEGSPQAAPNLPELYKVAWKLGVAERLSRAAGAAGNNVPPNSNQPRPTSQSSTMTPHPPPGPGQARLTNEQKMATSQGRKQLIEEMRAKGVEDMTW